MSRFDERSLLDKGDPKKLFDEWQKLAAGSYGTVWKVILIFPESRHCSHNFRLIGAFSDSGTRHERKRPPYTVL